MPEQVLGMTLPMFMAVLEGYREHLFDLKCLTVYAGYWAGYYSNAKRSKPLSEVLRKLLEEHTKAKKRNEHSRAAARPEVDVEQFLQRDRNFKDRMQRR